MNVGPDNLILPVKISGLTYRAGGRVLIDSIDVTLKAGPLTLIIGPNGAGKSLFLRLLTGLIEPTGGRIAWQGGNQAARPRRSLVFQTPRLLNRTVFDNAVYPLRLRHIEKPERAERVAEVLERTGITHLARQNARSLSGGEQGKLALARALVTRPDVLLMDEPTASLDPRSSHDIEQLIADIHEGGTKIIMTTHDLAQMRRLADELLFLHQGRLIEFGRAADMLKTPRSDTTAAFLNGELVF